MISPDAVADALHVIDPVFLASPQFEADTLGTPLGCALTVKVEVVNPIRSFKGRGAECFAASLASGGAGLVCASAGNFGQGLAWAARTGGHRSIRISGGNQGALPGAGAAVAGFSSRGSSAEA